MSYCVSCERKTPVSNPTPMRTSNGRIVLRSTCPVCATNKSGFMSRKKPKVADWIELYLKYLSLGRYSKEYLVVEPEKDCV